MLDLFSIPNFCIRKGRPTRSQVREERRLQRIPHGKTTSKEVSKETLWNHSRSIYPWHVVQKDDDRVLKKSSLRWARLANEDHPLIATEEELDVYRGNWWIRSNLVDSDTMPIRHRPDFKQALSTLHRLKKAEDKEYYENWSQSSSSWWQWQTNWWHPSPETSPRRWTWHWSSGATCGNQWIVYLFVAWISQRIWCKIYSDHFGNSQRSSPPPTGDVKSTSLDTANHYTNGYENSTCNIYRMMSNEDNNHDTNNINKNDTNNHDARKLHEWARPRRARCLVSVRLDVESWSSLAQVVHVSSLRLHVIHDVRFSPWPHLPPFQLQPDLLRLLPLLCLDAPWPAHRPRQPGLPWKITCATPPRGASTATTSSSPSQVMSPTTRVSNELVNSQGSSYITPSSDLDIADTTLGNLLTEAHRDYADYRSPEGVFVSQSSLSVVVDRTEKPLEKSNIDQFCFGVRNAYSAHNQFPAITQAERMVDRTVKTRGRNHWNCWGARKQFQCTD